MNPQDYKDYQENNVKASKSQLKEYIQIYAEMVKKLKSEDALELEAIKKNIKRFTSHLLMRRKNPLS